METRKRSITKTITFRIIASITTIILILILTGNLALAGIIGALDVISKLIIYYIHERMWDKINWGKKC